MAISERRKITLKAWRDKNKDRLIEYYRQYRQDNCQVVKEYGRDYREKHKEETATYNKKYKPEYIKKNRQRLAQYERDRRNYKYKHDISYRLMTNCRGRLSKAIRSQNCKKSSSTMDLIGCSIVELRQHLESLFLDGMSWENHGYGRGFWHIDHIIPCSRFDFADPEQQKICFNWKNLQPLWHEDNIRKSNKMPSEG